MLTPTSEPDGNHQCPFRESKGARASEASSRGMHVQGPSERALLSGTRLSGSPDGRGYSTSERNNRAMTGGRSSRCRTQVRRSGDVGGAGLLSEIETNYRAQPKDAAMLRKTNP